MELILFQEKFFDWVPSYKLGARAKNSANDEFEKRMNLKVFDVNEMLKPIEPVDFVLDNTSIGRSVDSTCWIQFNHTRFIFAPSDSNPTNQA